VFIGNYDVHVERQMVSAGTLAEQPAPALWKPPGTAAMKGRRHGA